MKYQLSISIKQKQLLAIYHLRICYEPKYLHINLRGFMMCKKLDPTCTECKKPFKPFHKNQFTCGKPECKKLRTNRIRKRRKESLIVKFVANYLGLVILLLFYVERLDVEKHIKIM